MVRGLTVTDPNKIVVHESGASMDEWADLLNVACSHSWHHINAKYRRKAQRLVALGVVILLDFMTVANRP